MRSLTHTGHPACSICCRKNLTVGSVNDPLKSKSVKIPPATCLRSLRSPPCPYSRPRLAADSCPPLLSSVLRSLDSGESKGDLPDSVLLAVLGIKVADLEIQTNSALRIRWTMAPYYRPVTSRCYVSTYRTICDSFREIILQEVENSLRTLNIDQFLLFPSFQQNIPLMYELMKCWNASEEGFIIKGHLLKFTADEVVTLTGLNNKQILFNASFLNCTFFISFNELFLSVVSANLYISPMHRIYKSYRESTDVFVDHISKEIIKRSNLLIIPIINNMHWTLLVGKLKERVWKLYDSLPNPQHKDICVTVINDIYSEMRECFDADITKWRLNIILGTPSQSNNFDCGMFICKYMKKLFSMAK
ncbi:hypothetical protein M5K25_003724 [Dendrobium thyrsiflorum]|uniref:Ubiquitin-like protease family profile domain-containing protein n=1 Tax=Dendrobium thyrsiflorum TaxID=117978 RepID=A0ABD0VJZ7_DENTH